MADRILDNGLILTDFADQMARFEDRQYQQYARQREAQDYERKLATENAANAARRQAAAGDMRGAQATAAQGDAWDVWGTIDAQQKAQVAKQAEAIGTAAYNLRRLPRGQARMDYFRAYAPTLLANGMSQEELAQYANSGVLDNDELLGGYADRAVGIQNLWKADQDKIEREYKRETDLMTPITAADGAVLTRAADGSITPIYTPGTKPLQEIIRNEDGSSSLVNIPGSPGTSYANGQPQQAMAGALSGLGLPANVVAGMMGNFHVEGGYTGQRGDGGSAAGVAQWRDERRANFVRMFGRDPAGAPIEDQAKFIVWEMQNPGRAGMTVAQRDAILAARTPAEAADLIDRHYERSSGAHRDRRIAAANAFAGQGSAPASGNGIQVTNLGGGRSGPEWRDETRTINGQQITGQVSTKTGQFRPYGGAGRPAKGVSDPVAAANAASTARQTVQQLLTHPGLGWSVGAYSLAPTIPGTRQADFKSMVETLKSQVFLGQISQMKGLGALTDAEGARLTASIASLDPSQSEEQFKRSLETIGGYFALAERRARAASSGGQAAPAQNGGGSRQAPAGATKTATGPGGQKMALVDGKWVAY